MRARTSDVAMSGRVFTTTTGMPRIVRVTGPRASRRREIRERSMIGEGSGPICVRHRDRSLLAGVRCAESVMRSAFCVMRSVYHTRDASLEGESGVLGELLATHHASRTTRNNNARRLVAQRGQNQCTVHGERWGVTAVLGEAATDHHSPY